MEELGLDGGLRRRAAVPGSIFVSMASYRDEQCLPTLVDMFDKARLPEALFVGLVDQRVVGPGAGVFPPNAAAPPRGGPADAPCLDFERDCLASTGSNRPHAGSVLCRFVSNVRTMHVPHYMARGPTFGRFAAAMLRKNESFFMMIDSHNRFASSWDLRVRNQYRLLRMRNVSKPVLSHYPESWRNPEDSEADAAPPPGLNDRQQQQRPKGGTVASSSKPPPPPPAPLDGRRTTTYLCKAKFLMSGIPRFDGMVVTTLPDRRPRPQPFAAAGFLFASMRVVSEVPFDPYLDYLFDGEEALYSARLWTHGYDIFSPGENILFHYYYRRKSKRVFRDTKAWLVPQLRSIHRVQHIMQLHPVSRDMNSIGRVTGAGPPDANSRVFRELNLYGLGTNRTLAQYWTYSGGDPVKRVFTRDFCKQFFLG